MVMLVPDRTISAQYRLSHRSRTIFPAPMNFCVGKNVGEFDEPHVWFQLLGQQRFCFQCPSTTLDTNPNPVTPAPAPPLPM